MFWLLGIQYFNKTDEICFFFYKAYILVGDRKLLKKLNNKNIVYVVKESALQIQTKVHSRQGKSLMQRPQRRNLGIFAELKKRPV